MHHQQLCVFVSGCVLCVNGLCSLALPDRQTASQVCFLATLCKMHVHMLSSEAEHSEAEPQALLSMSGHMVGVLAW